MASDKEISASLGQTRYCNVRVSPDDSSDSPLTPELRKRLSKDQLWAEGVALARRAVTAERALARCEQELAYAKSQWKHESDRVGAELAKYAKLQRMFHKALELLNFVGPYGECP